MKNTYLPYTNDFCNQDTFSKSQVGVDTSSGFIHLHPHYEFMCCLEAREQIFICQGKQIKIDYPFFILHKPFILHNSFLTEGTPVDATIVYFTSAWMEKFSSGTMLNKLFQGKNACLISLKEHFDLFRKIMDIFHSFPYNSVPQKQAMVMLLETAIMLNLENLFPFKGAQELNYIQKVMLDITEASSINDNIEEYAQKYYVSPTKLYRDFTNYAGITFHRFIMLVKLNEAKKMLSIEGANIIEVSERLGFADPTYFFPFFKRNTGMTPKQYLKSVSDHKNEK